MIQPEVMVVVPCFNEAARLPQQSFIQFADRYPSYHFLFVDDGSTDQTFARLEGLKEQRPGVFHLLKLEKNGGKAEAVRKGFLEKMTSGVPYLAFWDADLATPLEILPDFLNVFEQHPQVEIVLGARVNLLGRNIRRKALRHYLGRVFATFASCVLNLPVYDTQCGAKMFRVTGTLRDIFQKPFCSRWIFDVEILARYLKKMKAMEQDSEGCLYELPLQTWTDVAGSKLKPGDFLKAFTELIKIRNDNR